MCRTTLIPPELAHLQADLASSLRARLVGSPGLIPGVEPRAGGVITADDWDFSEDEDVEQDVERGLRRLSLQAREELLAQLRTDTRQMAHVRSVCARGTHSSTLLDMRARSLADATRCSPLSFDRGLWVADCFGAVPLDRLIQQRPVN